MQIRILFRLCYHKNFNFLIKNMLYVSIRLGHKIQLGTNAYSIGQKSGLLVNSRVADPHSFHNFYKFFSTFVGHFCPPGSGSTDPIESGSNPDPDPQPWLILVNVLAGPGSGSEFPIRIRIQENQSVPIQILQKKNISVTPTFKIHSITRGLVLIV